jgi:hypothetical protein
VNDRKQWEVWGHTKAGKYLTMLQKFGCNVALVNVRILEIDGHRFRQARYSYNGTSDLSCGDDLVVEARNAPLILNDRLRAGTGLALPGAAMKNLAVAIPSRPGNRWLYHPAGMKFVNIATIGDVEVITLKKGNVLPDDGSPGSPTICTD